MALFDRPYRAGRARLLLNFKMMNMEVVNNSKVSSFKQRKVTVIERYASRETTDGVYVPELRLRGLWLLEKGFSAGRRVVVDCVGDTLVISLAGEEAG